MQKFDPQLVQVMRNALEEVMTKVPLEYSNSSTKAYLAECILKAAAQGQTSYDQLIAAAADQIDQIQVVLSPFIWRGRHESCDVQHRPPHLFANGCHHPSVRGLLSGRYIWRINSKSAREWLQLTIRLSAPDMPDGAAKHGKTECHESVVDPAQRRFL
jgi:hypothetical protein